VPEYLYPRDEVPDYLGILVPNVDNVRTDFLIDTISKQDKAVLLIGEQVGATLLLIADVLHALNT
jgi:dynein heavy chain